MVYDSEPNNDIYGKLIDYTIESLQTAKQIFDKYGWSHHLQKTNTFMGQLFVRYELASF